VYFELRYRVEAIPFHFFWIYKIIVPGIVLCMCTSITIQVLTPVNEMKLLEETIYLAKRHRYLCHSTR
jgi:hypothetical protein